MSAIINNTTAQKQMREGIAKQICDRVECTTLLCLRDILECSGVWSIHHSGIYFLYNKDYELIYIGKIGFDGQSSLQKRMREHKSDSWFNEVRYVRFRRFPQMGDKQLSVAERLAIMYMEQPIYNDKNTSVSGLNEFNWSSLFLSENDA